ncbi:hypothetical protein SNOG_11834 [Parastagonospora nodorum SN15]|uniref:Uncharacterized protein n=1 Tax=Phaeosphaeria nodorum (strain SN15 / ATCC MYA-4574 / FGSC 10173) TaxID=321614 RepID=Q0U8T0_PHANO|nr:hypothetical protein SNOG_11834 [Parastagonospora nodorum SN15]EAT80878.1 hypothetical protein SNOG_11834 [Parastagonospora nodorum SN15]
MATLYSLTSDGFEQQFATNHLAHFLLFQLLKDAMLARATPQYSSRYPHTSSAWACIPKRRIYGWPNAIERHFGARNLHATSVHPGGITENSGLTKHVPEVELAALSSDEALVCTFKSSAQGAATQVYAAVSKEWASKGGRYLSGMVEQGSREEVGREEGMFEYANEGYAAWCYDTDGEERLWEDSLGMAGFA